MTPPSLTNMVKCLFLSSLWKTTNFESQQYMINYFKNLTTTKKICCFIGKGTFV